MIVIPLPKAAPIGKVELLLISAILVILIAVVAVVQDPRPCLSYVSSHIHLLRSVDLINRCAKIA
jgi:hypothetical protein